MSHHYSGPHFGFPNGDARLDLTDLYAFPKPGDAGKSILIMNVHPSVSLDPPGPTTSIPFAPNAIYEFKIDTNGDDVADVAYRVDFSPFTSDGQTATLRLITGPQAAAAKGGRELLIENAVVSLDLNATVTEGGRHRLFAGWRSDPFFFDPVGALNGFQFGKDFFTDKDVCSIVLEVPNSVLGPGQVGVWARTLTNVDGRWVQADRGARPAQTPFLPARPGRHTSPLNRPTTLISSPLLRTRWSTPGGMHTRMRSVWLEPCCRISCPSTTRSPRRTPAMAGSSPTMFLITS